ncbi:hypothetical protein BCR32DRAFT_329792 [Anaeromyces robustus]|uniref:Chitin-binding type-1 domain-containing protein n=1 Tax=Anaeromyces robustus TaxID=1754192 RepID=A0A1Y1WPK5_9FUNG|nr:hypothetical protein BCR32DRAFT_329792 [Anaeromyces robustus]|eukprot:ORX75479.1 hypothetical protein BCR32DRAFT_329792 [Anaeromyces robustus]
MDYGLCFESDDDGNDDYSNTKCGSDYGSCPNNLCCSSNNICGKTDNHCNLSKGCQLQYGLCYEDLGDDDGNNNTKCGPNYGSCPDNLCCSKQGYCGKTDDYCNVLNGCQNEYGLCYEYDDDDDDNDDDGNIKECGEGYGSCSNSKCCSKNGRCGTTDDYCNINKGCQIDYGLCYKPISDIREGSGKPCGRNYGSCDFPECCSKSDKCVLGTNECLESNGCQNDYGLCLSTI